MQHLAKYLAAGVGLISLGELAAADTPWKTVEFVRMVYGRPAAAADIGSDFSGKKLYAVGGGQINSKLSAAAIRVSSDGGKNWDTSEIFSIPNAGTDFWYQGFGAAPSGSIFAVGEAYQSGSGKNWIVRKSTDDGATWSMSDYLTEWKYYPSAWDVKATASGDIYVVGTYGGTCCPEWRLSAFQWFVRKSSDDGATWKTVDTVGSLAPYNFSGAHAIAIVNDAIFVAGFISSSPDWYGTEKWSVRKSVDGGATWTTVDQFEVEFGHGSAAEGITVTPNGEIFVVGSARGGSGNSPVTYWIVRRSVDGGASWQTVDSMINPTDRAAMPYGVASDPAGRIWVCGFTAQDYMSSGWLVRRGVPNDQGTMDWDNSDFVASQPGAANSVWSDRQGRIYVCGRTSDSDGIVAFTTRMLTPEAAAVKPPEDPFTPANPSPFHAPPLNVTQAGGSLLISWTQLLGGVLEYSDTIPSDVWKPIPNAPFPLGNENVVLLDMSARARFFRLRLR